MSTRLIFLDNIGGPTSVSYARARLDEIAAASPDGEEAVLTLRYDTNHLRERFCYEVPIKVEELSVVELLEESRREGGGAALERILELARIANGEQGGGEGEAPAETAPTPAVVEPDPAGGGKVSPDPTGPIEAEG